MSRPSDKKALEPWLKEAGLHDACEAVNCPEKGRIDRIFFRSSSAVSLQVTAWQVAQGFVDKEGKPLSDHDPIAATITWEGKVAAP